MQQQILKIEKKLDGLSKRDQLSLLVTVLAIMIMIWSTFIYAPLSDNKMVVEQDIAKKKTEMEVIQAKMVALQQSMSADPDAENRLQLNKYLEENIRLDAEFASTSTQFVSPQEMSSLLEQLLKTQTGLKFVSLQNKPAIPEFIESRDESEVAVENVNTIYRHSVVLKMEGSYHNTLSYLKKLEKFPWRFFWQSVEIETSGYPNTVITLEVYTLGFREGLIGA